MRNGFVSAVLLFLLPLPLVSCGWLEEVLPLNRQTYYGTKPLKPFAPEGSLRSGGIYRTLSGSEFNSVADVRPICTTDIEFIEPRIQTQRLPDTASLVAPTSLSH